MGVNPASSNIDNYGIEPLEANAKTFDEFAGSVVKSSASTLINDKINGA